MWGRWLTWLAALALWLLASPAGAQQIVPAPPSEAVPAAGLAADAPLVVDAAPNVATPAPLAGEAPRAAPLPFVAEIPRSPSPAPIARRWWFWAALGAAAVGLVVTAIVISPGDPYEGNANPGLVMPIF